MTYSHTINCHASKNATKLCNRLINSFYLTAVDIFLTILFFPEMHINWIIIPIAANNTCNLMRILLVDDDQPSSLFTVGVMAEYIRFL
jgi:hypothetical protein